MKGILLIRLARPVQLALAALTWLLGTSIANYLGRPFRNDAFWLGMLIMLLIQAAMNILAEAYGPLRNPMLEDQSPAGRMRARNTLLYSAIALLGTAAALAYVLEIGGHLPRTALFFLLLSLGFVTLHAVPPFRLIDRGFGEPLLAAQLAYVVPSIGFLLQAEANHRLVFTAALPLTCLGLAYFLVLNFETFSADQRDQRVTLLRRLSWERAIPLHNSLLAAAYTLFILESLFGMSLNLLWPAFLTAPFAILQVVLMRNISLGARPNWPLITSTALGVFGLTGYFLTLTFWLR